MNRESIKNQIKYDGVGGRKNTRVESSRVEKAWMSKAIRAERNGRIRAISTEKIVNRKHSRASISEWSGFEQSEIGVSRGLEWTKKCRQIKERMWGKKVWGVHPFSL